MLIQRNQKLEQLLTEDCKKALEEINRSIRLTILSELLFHPTMPSAVTVRLVTPLEEKEQLLVKEMLELAGWKSVRVKYTHVSFYF